MVGNSKSRVISVLMFGFALFSFGTVIACQRDSTSLPPGIEAKLRKNSADLRQSYYLIRKSIVEGNIQKVAYFYHNLWQKSKDKKVGLLFAFSYELAIEPSFFTVLSPQQEKMMVSLQTRILSDEADQCWQVGLATFPDSAEAILFDTYRQANRNETVPLSVTQARKAVKLDPKWAYPYRILAGNLLQLIHSGQDKTKKSALLEEAYESAIAGQRLDPNSISKMQVSSIYEKKGQYKTALVYLDGAIAEQSNLSPSQNEVLQSLRKNLLNKMNASKTSK